jgi:hypothetical protein
MGRPNGGGKAFITTYFLLWEQIHLTGPTQKYNNKSWIRFRTYLFKGPLGTPRNGWEENIEMDFRGME